MKKLLSTPGLLAGLCLSLSLSLAGPARAADDHGHGAKALHGGVLVEASHLELELVHSGQQLRLYVRDHGKALPLQGASARLILLQGSARSELQLAPVEDRLEATTARPAAGSKVLASLSLPGRRAVQARFVMP